MAVFTIVDTDILIDAGRGVGEAVACLQDIERKSSLAASVVTQMELFVGCRNKTELHEAKNFFGAFSFSSSPSKFLIRQLIYYVSIA